MYTEESFDLLEVIQDMLERERVGTVFLSMPDARVHAEAIVLGFGLNDTDVAFYDSDTIETYRVTVSVRMVNQAQGQNIADKIRSALMRESLDSKNGSYEYESRQVDLPIPVPWDASGRFIWTVEARIKVLRKEWF
jgi:hypothetical protein